MKFDNRIRDNFYIFRSKIRRKIASTFLSFGLSMLDRNLTKVPNEILHRIPDLNLSITKKNRGLFELFYRNEVTAKLWFDGECKKAIIAQKDIFSELYEYLGLNNNSHFPTFMSSNWTNRIGHFSYLGVYSKAQEMKLIPEQKRFLLRNNREANLDLLKSVSKHFNVIDFASGTDWTELPNFWHTFERLDIVKTNQDFMHIYELFEKVMNTRKILGEGNKPILTLDSEYILNSSKVIEKLGLPKDSKFVGLHIREANGTRNLRSQPINSYIPAINFIISMGYSVVRIGDRNVTKFPPMKGLIDLPASNVLTNTLDAFVLGKSSFFIGTNSGPANIPMLYGVPTLHTNSTSIGKNMLTFNQGSRYIPKVFYTKNDRKLSLSGLLDSPIAGYSEHNKDQMLKAGLKFENNSSEDILDGVKEMMEQEEKDLRQAEVSTFEKSINEIRAEFKPIGYGDFSNSFLEKNADWFLV